MKRIALIVAGGTGTRMGAEIPKQFLLLKGKPMLMQTIERFYPECTHIIVVLPDKWINYWKQLCEKFQFTINHQITAGGSTRAESVRNGLNNASNDSIVAVHDAARPLVSRNLIEKLYITAEKSGNAIPVIPVKDSLRLVEGNSSKAVNREMFRLVQTPQCFHTEKLIAAFGHEDYSEYSDEASLVQALGQVVHLVEGEVSNVKITSQEDLFFAEHYNVSY